MTAREAVAEGTGALEAGRPGSPFLDATILLAHAMDISRDALLARLPDALDDAVLHGYRALVARRLAGEPVAYITGRREFWGLPFRSDPRALMPRPETEHLVETALSMLPPPRPGRRLRCHDAFAGSGCVGIALASERPDIEMALSDASGPALELCAENAAAFLPADRPGGFPAILRGDILSAASAPLDAIVANPPYVSSALTREILGAGSPEPADALDGGPDGLAFYDPLAAQAFRLLNPGGFLAVETGDEQGPAVAAILEAAGFRDARIVRDLAGLDRVVAGVKRA